MGRRKERRIAANAGRRVKLDLFAEPSGDVGGSSTQEKAGGGDGSKIDAKSPSSPSSSGQPHNPLLLLEQYSDEELDEDSSDGDNHATEDASAGVDDQVIEEIADIEKNAGDEPPFQPLQQPLMDTNFTSVEPSQNLEKGGMITNDSDDFLGGTNEREEDANPVARSAPEKQPAGDIRLGWKKVLHEESNQYYYWNVTTGETSWEAPDVFALDTDATSVENAVSDTEEKINATTGTLKNITQLDGEDDDIIARELNVDFVLNHENNNTGFGRRRKGESSEGSEGNTFAGKDENRDDSQSHGFSLPGDTLGVNGIKLESGHFGENETCGNVSSELVEHCERILKKLNSVKGLNWCLEGEDLKLKYTLEIETRLNDIKALAAHGSRLLPFWLHSEVQLKQIEEAVDNIIEHAGSASISEFEATLKSCEDIGDDIEMDSGSKKAMGPALESHSPECTSEKSDPGTQNDAATNSGHLPSVWYQPTYSAKDVGQRNEIDGIAAESKLTPRPDNHSAQEVDMDVDMEVEETSTSVSGFHYTVTSETPNLHETLGNQEPAVPGLVFSIPPPVEEWVPPPPPDDEPFPPPPPDDEPFPPPPPDEPPEPSYPPNSQLESVQHFPYSENYSLPYSGSSLEYYGQTHPESSATSLYMTHEGAQVAGGHLPHYYEAMASTYGSAPAVVDPVVPSAYYALPVPFAGVSTMNYSGAPSNPVSENFRSDKGGSVDLQPGAPTISSVEKGVSVSSSDPTTAVTAATSTASKVQSKASRNKKRTAPVGSTLKANKKVSSLVDKWKAVKEELNDEEEEEPEDPYEILERKRQREIEEWRAQQIASGEAKENANFQPLGGDWRERVKRKRAEKMKESVQRSSDAPTDVKKQKEKPDLVELSKALPSGWQAYWDESSKSVYYGNVLTSETTWTKPKAR